jgi:hypothetical protein
VLTASGQECKSLDDGKYYFKHSTKGYRKTDFMLTITGDNYFITRDGEKYQKDRIKWWQDKCKFKLNSDDVLALEKNDSSNLVQKTGSLNVLVNTDPGDVLRKTFLSYGGTCYELNGRRRFRLTYCGNIHITLAEGRIIKK